MNLSSLMAGACDLVQAHIVEPASNFYHNEYLEGNYWGRFKIAAKTLLVAGASNMAGGYVSAVLLPIASPVFGVVVPVVGGIATFKTLTNNYDMQNKYADGVQIRGMVQSARDFLQ